MLLKNMFKEVCSKEITNFLKVTNSMLRIDQNIIGIFLKTYLQQFFNLLAVFQLYFLNLDYLSADYSPHWIKMR